MDKNTTKKIFAQFQALYGHKWTSSYSDPQVLNIALDLWTRKLEDLPESWVARAVDSWRGDWPPSLPELVSASLPTPKQLGMDDIVRRNAIKACAGDEYNFRRMPADRSVPALARAIAEEMDELNADILNRPGHYEDILHEQRKLASSREKLESDIVDNRSLSGDRHQRSTGTKDNDLGCPF